MVESRKLVKHLNIVLSNVAELLELLTSTGDHSAAILCGWRLCGVRNSEGFSEVAICYADFRVELAGSTRLASLVDNFIQKYMKKMFLCYESEFVHIPDRSVKEIVKTIEKKADSFSLQIPYRMISQLKMLDSPTGYYFKKLEVKVLGKVNPDPALFRPEIYNFDAMCAFIGGILTGKAPKHQYLWIYGEGRSGKTAFTNALCRFIGDSLSSRSDMSRIDSRFFRQSLVGKLLCVFDEGSSNLKHIDAFKYLVSDGQITVERKYTTALELPDNPTNFIVVSNHLPNLENDMANRRRCILCKFPSISDECLVGDAEQKMIKFMPQFAGYCVEQAKSLIRPEGIKCDFSLFDKVTAKPDPIEEWASALATYIEPNVNGTVRAHTLVKIVIENCLQGKDKFDSLKVKEVIARVHEFWGIALCKKRKNFGFVYEGIELKPLNLENMR